MTEALATLNEQLSKQSALMKSCPAKYCRAIIAMMQIQEHIALVDLSLNKDRLVAAELRGYIVHCRMVVGIMEAILEGTYDA